MATVNYSVTGFNLDYNAKATAITAGIAITSSRALTTTDIDKLTLANTSSGAITLTLNSGIFTTVGQTIAIRRSGASAVTFASGTATVSNPNNVDVADGDVFLLYSTGADTAIVMGADSDTVKTNATQTLLTKIVLLAAIPASDDTYEGLGITGRNAGATIAQWEAVYLDSSGTWQLADANGTGTYPCRGLAVAGASSSQNLVVLDNGVARNDAWAWTVGGDIYLSTTAGGLTQTAPSASGDKIQKIGYALSADSIRVMIGQGEYVTVT